MKLNVWHVTVAILLIGYVFGASALIAYVLYGPGLEVKVPDILGLNPSTTTTSAGEQGDVIAPDLLAGYSGVLFECEGGKALKVEFLEGKVNLALSDGRRITLPETVYPTDGWEPRITAATYANTDGSFAFGASLREVEVYENQVATYQNCVAS